jgi:hypothetical protein
MRYTTIETIPPYIILTRWQYRTPDSDDYLLLGERIGNPANPLAVMEQHSSLQALTIKQAMEQDRLHLSSRSCLVS